MYRVCDFQTGAGAIAQLGERVLCKHEVVGSIPSGSTRRAGRRTRGIVHAVSRKVRRQRRCQSRVLLHREEETCSDNRPGAARCSVNCASVSEWSLTAPFPDVFEAKLVLIFIS